MIKLLLKLAIAALIANATWRLGTAYTSFYKFKDAVQDTTQFAGDKTDEQLRQRILDLAEQYDVPLAASRFALRRDESHTTVDGSYVRRIDLLPGYAYPWPFTFHTETLNIKGLKRGSGVP